MAMPKLQPKTVKQIKVMHNFGLTLKQLASQYNVSVQTIWRAIHGVGKGYARDR